MKTRINHARANFKAVIAVLCALSMILVLVPVVALPVVADTTPAADMIKIDLSKTTGTGLTYFINYIKGAYLDKVVTFSFDYYLDAPEGTAGFGAEIHASAPTYTKLYASTTCSEIKKVASASVTLDNSGADAKDKIYVNIGSTANKLPNVTGSYLYVWNMSFTESTAATTNIFDTDADAYLLATSTGNTKDGWMKGSGTGGIIPAGIITPVVKADQEFIKAMKPTKMIAITAKKGADPFGIGYEAIAGMTYTVEFDAFVPGTSEWLVVSHADKSGLSTLEDGASKSDDVLLRAGGATHVKMAYAPGNSLTTKELRRINFALHGKGDATVYIYNFRFTETGTVAAETNDAKDPTLTNDFETWYVGSDWFTGKSTLGDGEVVSGAVVAYDETKFDATAPALTKMLDVATSINDKGFALEFLAESNTAYKISFDYYMCAGSECAPQVLVRGSGFATFEDGADAQASINLTNDQRVHTGNLAYTSGPDIHKAGEGTIGAYRYLNFRNIGANGNKPSHYYVWNVKIVKLNEENPINQVKDFSHPITTEGLSFGEYATLVDYDETKFVKPSVSDKITKMAEITVNNNDEGFAHSFEVKPNTTYTFSFKYYILGDTAKGPQVLFRGAGYNDMAGWGADDVNNESKWLGEKQEVQTLTLRFKTGADPTKNANGASIDPIRVAQVRAIAGSGHAHFYVWDISVTGSDDSTDNLVNDFSRSGNTTGWGGNIPLVDYDESKFVKVTKPTLAPKTKMIEGTYSGYDKGVAFPFVTKGNTTYTLSFEYFVDDQSTGVPQIGVLAGNFAWITGDQYLRNDAEVHTYTSSYTTDAFDGEQNRFLRLRMVNDNQCHVYFWNVKAVAAGTEENLIADPTVFGNFDGIFQGGTGKTSQGTQGSNQYTVLVDYDESKFVETMPDIEPSDNGYMVEVKPFGNGYNGLWYPQLTEPGKTYTFSFKYYATGTFSKVAPLARVITGSGVVADAVDDKTVQAGLTLDTVSTCTLVYTPNPEILEEAANRFFGFTSGACNEGDEGVVYAWDFKLTVSGSTNDLLANNPFVSGHLKKWAPEMATLNTSETSYHDNFVVKPLDEDYLGGDEPPVVTDNGDVNGNGVVNSEDAIYLLRHTLKPADFPLTCSGDVNGNGVINSEDAIYLLRHTLKPADFPLYPKAIG